MIPKAGDIVRLNPSFLKVWFDKGNKYLKEEVWKENIIVKEVQDLGDKIKIIFESKDYKYRIFILYSGELSLSNLSKELKGIQVFIPANPENNKNDMYCSCGGPKKENWVFGERFYVCTVCKKEVI